MRRLNLDELSDYLSQRRDVIFAVLFGSAQDGQLGADSDVDIGILFGEKHDLERRVELLADIARLLECDEIDLSDLETADPFLGFEAISGRFLCKNDRDKTAEACSLICREYEDAMVQLHRVA